MNTGRPKPRCGAASMNVAQARAATIFRLAVPSQTHEFICLTLDYNPYRRESPANCTSAVAESRAVISTTLNLQPNVLFPIHSVENAAQDCTVQAISRSIW